VAQPVSQYDEYEERDGGFELVGEQRDEAPPRGNRRLVAIALTLAVMLLFAGGLWFAYVQGTRHAGGSAQNANAVPLLRADERPTKIKPDQPGGMPVPDQNVSFYNEKLAKSPVEKLLPPPEQPMPRPAPSSTKPAAAPQILMPPPEAGPAEAGPAPVAAPPQAAAPQAATPQATAPQAVQKAAVPASTETAPGTAAGTVQVRLGSLRSPDAAREEWQRLKRANGDLLGDLRANAVSVDLGEKGIYYRIMAGPLDEAAAEKLCNEMKRRSHGCIVAR
jgi:cbb3-type cytochrome oxidase subunit 3